MDILDQVSFVTKTLRHMLVHAQETLINVFLIYILLQLEWKSVD